MSLQDLSRQVKTVTGLVIQSGYHPASLPCPIQSGSRRSRGPKSAQPGTEKATRATRTTSKQNLTDHKNRDGKRWWIDSTMFYVWHIFLQVSVELKIKFLEMFRKNVNIHLCNRWKRHFHWQICLYIFRLFFYGSSLFSFFKFQPPQMSKQTKRKKKNVHKNVKVKKIIVFSEICVPFLTSKRLPNEIWVATNWTLTSLQELDHVAPGTRR